MKSWRILASKRGCYFPPDSVVRECLALRVPLKQLLGSGGVGGWLCKVPYHINICGSIWVFLRPLGLVSSTVADAVGQ